MEFSAWYSTLISAVVTVSTTLLLINYLGLIALLLFPAVMVVGQVLGLGLFALLWFYDEVMKEVKRESNKDARS